MLGSRWERFAGWIPAFVGLGLWSATAAHVLRAGDPAGALFEMWLPVAAGAGLLAAARRRRGSRYHGTFALWTLAGVVFGVTINEWFFVLLSPVDVRAAVDVTVVNANAVSAIVTFTALIGHYYANMQETVRELRETNERLEDFASVVSHDLRNPLNIVQGHLALARETGEERHFEAMDRAARRMERLICEVLALSRTGEAEARYETNVEVGSLARRAAAAVDTGSVEMVVDADASIAADPVRLQTLLENLIDNAMTHGGPDLTTVRVGILEDASGFYVEDDGAGVPPRRRERVFEGGYSTVEDGRGFGLSVVRRVSEAHGWTHVVTESDAGGARVEIGGVERRS